MGAGAQCGLGSVSGAEAGWALPPCSVSHGLAVPASSGLSVSADNAGIAVTPVQTRTLRPRDGAAVPGRGWQLPHGVLVPRRCPSGCVSGMNPLNPPRRALRVVCVRRRGNRGMEGFRCSSEATQLESGSLRPASSDERRRRDPFQVEGGFQPLLALPWGKPGRSAGLCEALCPPSRRIPAEARGKVASVPTRGWALSRLRFP